MCWGRVSFQLVAIINQLIKLHFKSIIDPLVPLDQRARFLYCCLVDWPSYFRGNWIVACRTGKIAQRFYESLE